MDNLSVENLEVGSDRFQMSPSSLLYGGFGG